MKRLIRRLRHKMKAACVVAAVVTCWNVGQPANADYSPGETVNVHFSGSIAPTVNDLKHVYLIYGTGYSGLESDLSALFLGDFVAGNTTPFNAYGVAEYNQATHWGILGLYGDISGGIYDGEINGVTVALDWSAEGRGWSNAFYQSNEAEESLFNYLYTKDTATLLSYLDDKYEFMCSDYEGYLEFSNTVSLYDFSEASNNGSVALNSEIVPEPITVLLVGAGSLMVLRRKRKTGL